MMYGGDDFDDPDAPQAIDLEGDDDEGTVDCPACGRPIHEAAAICPHCGCWIVDDTVAGRRSRGWFWPIMVALLIVIILVMWHGFRR